MYVRCESVRAEEPQPRLIIAPTPRTPRTQIDAPMVVKAFSDRNSASFVGCCEADRTGMGRSWRRAGSYQVTKVSSEGNGPGAAGGSFEGQHVCGSRLDDMHRLADRRWLGRCDGDRLRSEDLPSSVASRLTA